MTEIEMLRGKAAETICKNNNLPWGSPLYCDCGCQTNLAVLSNLDYNLTGITVAKMDGDGTGGRYADLSLIRNGERVGTVNTQYDYISLDGTEYLGIKKHSPLYRLILEAGKIFAETKSIETRIPYDAIESANIAKIEEDLDIADQDDRNKNHFGYCKKCHTYCYGDCEAN